MSTSANTATMSRRAFTSAAGAALVAGATLASTAHASEDPESAAGQAPRDPMAELWAGGYASEYTDQVTAVEEADIVVVGAGVSGISAALEAAQQGVSVILLESQAIAGGNGNYTDCVFTFGSPQQLEAAEAAGMTVTADQIIRSEIELYDYMVDGELWADVLEHSADNTQWLLDAGCLTGETAVFYGGELGKTPTALMWAGGIGTGGVCAMTPMLETLKGLGVEPTLNTRARALKVAGDGSVCGVYAEGPDGVVEYGAKAVILAGGGWGANPELCSKLGGYDMSKSSIFSAPGCQGDTLKMAAAIGCRQDAVARGYMFGNGVPGITTSYLMQYHPAVWVNQNGRRFANEDCGETCHDYTGTAVRSQKDVFIILDDAMIDDMDAALVGSQNADGSIVEGVRPEIEAAVADAENPAAVMGADVQELAELIGVDAATLEQTLATYNDYCADGHDAVFGKAEQYLRPLGDGPLYGLRVSQTICLSLGGINTNRNWQVVDMEKNPIPGLYAVGADGQMVYLGLYNLNTSGGHMAVNFESGRYSVKHAIEHCL